ncbi:hypothetical protein CDIK_2550 [Cucumispora dikerogammari]|nr:hypothetical protein CDIK_2550 [Cucumispora dikerogammari]
MLLLVYILFLSGKFSCICFLLFLFFFSRFNSPSFSMLSLIVPMILSTLILDLWDSIPTLLCFIFIDIQNSLNSLLTNSFPLSLTKVSGIKPSLHQFLKLPMIVLDFLFSIISQQTYLLK